MKKVLYITANPKAEGQSFSLEAGRKFIEKYKSENPNDNVIEMDLYDMEIPLIDADVFSGWGKLGEGISFDALSEAEKAKVGFIGNFTEQFIEADKYVFVTPMWNLSLPPKVKAYLDTVMIAGKTFAYTENGPVGLLKDKKALHVHSTGGIYSGDMAGFDFGNRYLQTVLNFMGVQDVESVVLEGTNMGKPSEEIKAVAETKLGEIVQSF